MILLDTDVLIDVALDRAPYSEPAAELLEQIERGRGRHYRLAHSFKSLLHYGSSQRK